MKQVEIAKQQEEIDKINDDIERITGVKDEDAAITTTSVGDAAVPGGRANFAPKMGMVRRKRKDEDCVCKLDEKKKKKKKKKKTKRSKVHSYVGYWPHFNTSDDSDGGDFGGGDGGGGE